MNPQIVTTIAAALGEILSVKGYQPPAAAALLFNTPKARMGAKPVALALDFPPQPNFRELVS
jgi:hypothetical protein